MKTLYETKTNEIQCEMSIDLLVALMKGDRVILCGKGDEPSVALVLDELPSDLDDAVRQIERGWEW